MDKQVIVPPYVMLDARKYAKAQEFDHGDVFELRMQHHFEGEYRRACDGELDGLVMRLARSFTFQVDEYGGANFISSTEQIVEDRTTDEPRCHTLECGHPLGCGEPCGWCETKRHLVQIVAAAAVGDVELAEEMLTKAAAFLKSDD